MRRSEPRSPLRHREVLAKPARLGGFFTGGSTVIVWFDALQGGKRLPVEGLHDMVYGTDRSFDASVPLMVFTQVTRRFRLPLPDSDQLRSPISALCICVSAHLDSLYSRGNQRRLPCVNATTSTGKQGVRLLIFDMHIEDKSSRVLPTQGCWRDCLPRHSHIGPQWPGSFLIQMCWILLMANCWFGIAKLTPVGAQPGISSQRC
ncbi:hypothetical protein C9I56_01785 [Paraburkholderia caribensis]|uniref:Uncharacterized protein n=1 Tax=Paraburkholderia caribensis TaxID=75105 RepID=A0A9Q6S0G8_9BURK|nr:hypothetical protein C9I56_01785 [Paraburkholderia caribensis]QLB62255.1 hypothetical protein A9O66_07600 [Paraburkholderia caribensis]